MPKPHRYEQTVRWTRLRETIDYLQLALCPREERFDLGAEFRQHISIGTGGHIA